MNIQAKSRFVIILTLFIGVTLGVLIDRTLLHQSFERRIERFRGPGGFGHLIERIIEPNSTQMAQIKAVLEKHSEKMYNYRLQSREEMKALMDSLHIELEPILTAEQKEKLKESLKKMERGPFDSHGKRSKRRFDREGMAPPPDIEKEKPFRPEEKNKRDLY